MTRAKVILVIVAILFVIFLGLGSYILFFGGRVGETPSDELPPSGEDGIPNGEMLEGPANGLYAGPVASFGVMENELIVVRNDGFIEILDRAGVPVEQAGTLGTDVRSAIVSPARDLIAFTDASGQWSLYYFEDGRIESLPAATHDLHISPDGTLVLVEEDAGGTTVSIRGQGTRTVFSSDLPDLEASWIDARNIAITSKASGIAPGFLYLLDTNSRRLIRFLGNRFGLTSLVSPDRSWAVFSETNTDGKRVAMRALDMNTREEKTLSVSTLPEKCTFSAESGVRVYCATLSANASAALMPDEYRFGSVHNSESSLVRIDLTTGIVEVLAEQIKADPIMLRVDSSEQTLFFIDKNTGSLNQLRL